MRHHTLLAGLTVAAALISTTALAGEPMSGESMAGDPMAGTYGNTVVTTDKATGAVGRLMFDPGKTYTGEATGKDGKPVRYAGTWMTKDGDKTICLTMTVPAGQPPAAPSCSPLEPHKAGDSWTVTNDQKQTFDITLQAGH